ncbi:N/A [soil metagenome]
MARIRVPSVLRPLAGGSPSLESPAGTVGDLQSDLSARFPDLAARLYGADGELQEYVNLFIDGEDARELGPEAPLAQNSEVVLLPAISGG